MLVGSALIITPIFLATGVRVSGQGRALLLGLAVAVLSSALPYALELAAIKRVRPSTYGVLLSIEPAIAALWGFVILSQRLALRELLRHRGHRRSRRRVPRGPARRMSPVLVVAPGERTS